MKIILINSSLTAGGSERVTAWLASGLAERGHEVTLVVRSDPDSDFYDVHPSVKLRRTYSAPWRTPRSRGRRLRDTGAYVRLYRRLLIEERPDVALSFLDRNNLYAIAGATGLSTPVVVSERVDPFYDDITGSHELGALRRLRPYLYRRSAGLVVQSPKLAERVRHEWQLPRVTAIPNAARFLDVPQVSLPERPPSVISVGRLVPQKDHETLLRAWAECVSDFPDWRLSIYGDGSLRDSLEETRWALGLATTVHINPPTRDISDEFAASQIIALPSLYEGFPNALLEGMSLGCAAVAADGLGATGELLGGGRFGLLHGPGDVDGLTHALRKLMGDQALREDFGRRARSRAEQFSPRATLDAWEHQLLECASPATRRHLS